MEELIKRGFKNEFLLDMGVSLTKEYKGNNYHYGIVISENGSVLLTNYDEDKYSDDFIRIPTIREIEALPMAVRESNDYYWTMTSSYSVSEDCSYASVFYVYSNGSLDYDNVNFTDGVRPVIEVSNKILELKENN